MIDWVVDREGTPWNGPAVRLGLGNSADYEGDADLVFSHLYGPLPPQLVGKPAFVNVYGNKREAAERWCGAPLIEVSRWGKGLTNTLYVANSPVRHVEDLTDLVEDEFAPGRGWFPEALVRRMLKWRLSPCSVVFDGFMGRGTVGRICLEEGLGFVGIDIDPERVAIAREYLGC